MFNSLSWDKLIEQVQLLMAFVERLTADWTHQASRMLWQESPLWLRCVLWVALAVIAFDRLRRTLRFLGFRI
ncbi:MAG: hypothetical protein C4521_11930 [Actinobacteria bacterium]|nr:MAG: hypothetical protein C4521_11930 [Actinomycetota bacterium]